MLLVSEKEAINQVEWHAVTGNRVYQVTGIASSIEGDILRPHVSSECCLPYEEWEMSLHEVQHITFLLKTVLK